MNGNLLDLPFTGSFRFALDKKHRLYLPPLFRSRMGNPVWLTLGDRHLGLRSAAEWTRTCEGLLPAESERFCALSWEREVRAGRIQLPCSIWSEFGWKAGEEVVVVGQRTWVRLEKLADWHARVRGDGPQLSLGLNGALARTR